MFELKRHGEALHEAVTTAFAGVSVDLEDAADGFALTFVHPAHDAACILVLEPDQQAGVALLVAVVIGDWEAARQQDMGARLFALNPRLMTCAVGLLPINGDEIAVVLCRRAPVDAVAPAEAVSLLDDMIWEYAHLSGWAEQADSGKDSEPVAEVRPRLITSLDDLEPN
jgi:hypothetical protein